MFLLCAASAIVMHDERHAGHAGEAPSPSGEKPLLGQLYLARGPIHRMARQELLDELTERGAPHGAVESDDRLRLRVHEARGALLDQRNELAQHAERVLREVEQHSGGAFLADSSLDTVLADDNAVFAASLGRRLIGAMNMQAAGGTALGLALWCFAPLGRLEACHRLLPLPAAPLAARYGSVAVATAALLGLLQGVTQYLRRFFDHQSFFGQKLAAVACREG
eukprot:2387370-Prymnesium_polylepis.1